MPSNAHVKFEKSLIGASVLSSHAGSPSQLCTDQSFVDQICLKAAVAHAVGVWEGYVEGAIREFVSKVRVQSHRQTWALITQFELMVDRRVSGLNTPNWEKVRELIMEVTGMDPYVGWIWSPKFSNQADTKEFFNGILAVRHAFAHGFDIPTDISGLITPGVLDQTYVGEAILCLKFFCSKTEELLEHELMHRHSCRTGWS